MFPRPNFQLEVLAECGSTNDELFARRAEPSFHGRALLALRQTAGHGRRGREWWSGEGNLFLSVGFRLEAGAALPLLPFAAGLAVADALREFLPPAADVRLKWPNDVYLDGKKISGLISQVRQAGAHADLVLGIGVNLRVAPPDLPAIALGEGAPSPEEFARALLAHLADRLGTKDFPALRSAWEEIARIEGALLRIEGEEGEFWGRGLLPSGELEVEDAQGRLRRLSSEVVSLRFR